MDWLEYITPNWALLKHPANWFIVGLMLIIALIAVDVLRDIFAPPAQTKDQS